MSDLSPREGDLNLRLVRYFTVVAGYRHFGRAAAELRIAQPSLTRQIRQLEAQVGARLLDRDRQGTQLTEAGEAFLTAPPFGITKTISPNGPVVPRQPQP